MNQNDVAFRCVVTAHKRSLGQGNVLTPVCHSVHRGGGGLHLEGSASREGLHPGEGSASRGGVCIRGRGLHPGEGSASGEEVCIQGRGLHPAGLARTPPSDTMGYGQRVGSTHPTGIHSCSY